MALLGEDTGKDGHGGNISIEQQIWLPREIQNREVVALADFVRHTADQVRS